MRHYYDAIVIGSGIAGLTSAIYLKKFGLDVIVLTKNSNLTESNTYYAQGGIIAAKDGDSPEKLRDDIFQAGASYNNLEAVDFFAQQGPQLVFDFLVNMVGID